ncbi:helix-turn-helix domain-containing protein [Streptomyces sp. NBC_01304]|uniref:helix-turn-helix domain-containing protein n=1 Tax=Streptomyces sp. NBC_01304 TaxID=2903818 RepID=UPI002E108C41|nr:helix-turn-helix domain-containing protein [Streptomyces sp. NBC_01304]
MPPRLFDGRRLNDARRAARRTQSDVADALGVAPSSVGSWETGQWPPDAEKLPALAAAVGRDLDELFPRPGLPDLADLRCDAGVYRQQVLELIGTKSAGPVSNAEKGVRRLSEQFVEPLAKGYGVSVEALLAAQERSFGNEAPPPATEVPKSLAEKISYLLAHSYPGPEARPSDADLARHVNEHAGAPIATEADICALRTGVEIEASPALRDGLAAVFGVSPMYFQPHEATARQVVEGLQLLASGNVGKVAARGLGKEGLSADLLAYINEVAAELQQRDLPGAEGSRQ